MLIIALLVVIATVLLTAVICSARYQRKEINWYRAREARRAQRQ